MRERTSRRLPGALPTPEERLRERIEARGRVSFAEFMEEALYGPGGYYARAQLPIGEDRDFVTGSSLSPLFGQATARLVEALDGALARPADLLEVGYGDGAHLGAVVASLAEPGRRRVLGCDRVARPLPAGAERLRRLEDVEPGEIQGLIFSYELFDAIPVHRLIGGEAGLEELWVGVDDDGRFTWRQGELSSPALADLPGAPIAIGQIADLSPGWRPLYRSLGRRLGRGLLVTCDYGFTATRLLDPRVRSHGTLACYRRQHVHRNPFTDVGRQDLTAHVDFSALIEEGEAEGLETFTLTRQAPWLAACGLLEGVAEADAATRIAVQQLMQLDGMGEDIRVLVQARGVDPAEILGLGQLA